MRGLATISAALLALAACAGATIESAAVGGDDGFFDLPAWMPEAVPSDRTPGSGDYETETRRLDGTWASAFYAAFEAHAERAYYTSLGASNSWDEADFGSTEPGPGFRFGLPTNDAPSFVWKPDTNRVVRSRRLLGWGNYDRLAGRLHGVGRQNLCDLFGVSRPGWPDPATNRWSSTVFDYEGLAGEYPAFDWTETPLAAKSVPRWRRTCLTWDGLTEDADSPINYTDGHTTPLVREMFERVRYGEPATDDDALELRWPTGEAMVSNTCAGVLRLPFAETAEITTTNYLGAVSVSDGWLLEYVDYFKQQQGYYDMWYWVGFEPTGWSYDAASGYIICKGAVTVQLWNEDGSAGVSTTYQDADQRLYVGAGIETNVIVCTVKEDFAMKNLHPTGGYSQEPDELPADVWDFSIVTTRTDTNYNAHVEEITNGTLRIRTERMSALDQIMSCLDRTYHVCGFDYPAVTNVEHTASDVFATDAPLVVPLGSDGKTVASDTYLTTAFHSTTNATVTTNATEAASDRYTRYRSPTATTVGTFIAAQIGGELYEDSVRSISLALAVRLAGAFRLIVKDHGADDGGVWLNVYPEGVPLDMRGIVVSPGSWPTNTAFFISVQLTRSYYWRRSVALDLEAFRPAPAIYTDRIGALQDMILASAARYVGTEAHPATYPLEYEEWMTNAFTSAYLSETATDATIAQMRSRLSAASGELRSKMAEFMGDGFMNPSQVIPLPDAWASAGLEKYKIPAGTVLDRWITDDLGDLAALSGSDGMIDTLEYADGTSIAVTPDTLVEFGHLVYGLLGSDITTDDASPFEETYGVCVDGKLDFRTRVDWAWKNLRRMDEEDEQ